jgi:hypothetical protein
MEEVLRIRELMGLKSFLKEGLYSLTKMLLKEDTGIGEIMNAFKTAFRKASVELTEEEKIYIRNLVDEYNARFADEYGNINFTGKIDNTLRSAILNIAEKEADEVLLDFWTGALKRVTRSNIGKEGLQAFPSLDDTMKELMQSEKVSDDLLDADGNALGLYDTLVYIFQKGGVRQSELPDSILSVLKDQLDYYRRVLPEYDPLKKYCDDVVDQIDEVQTGETKFLPEEDIAIIRNELPAIENNIKNPLDPIVIDVTDDFEIRFDEDDIGLGRTPESVRKEAINKVMDDMEKKCKVGFCKTMVAYWKKDNKKFQDMWSYIYKKLASGVKPTAQSRFYQNAPQALVDEYELILKEFGKRDTPFTPSDYIELGQEIYEKMKKSGELGWIGGAFTPFKDLGVFTSKDMLYRTLGYVTIGSDPFKGGWTLKGMWDRWWKMNLIWFPIVLTYNVIEAGKGSEDPTETNMDQFIDLLLSTAKDAAFLGLAPGPRLFFEGGISYTSKKLGGSKYVDFPTLVEFLNKQHGWTENQVYDNLINKGLVTTFRDSTPPYTKVSGATDIFAVANGKYEITSTNLLRNLFRPKVVFTPEGQLAPDPNKNKLAKIDKAARNEIQVLLKDDSWISDSIKINVLGNKVLDFDRQESGIDDVTGNQITILVYKMSSANGKNAEIFFKYDPWVAAGKPELASVENYNKYVKSKVIN